MREPIKNRYDFIILFDGRFYVEKWNLFLKIKMLN